jgi:hypothetical protein
MIQVGVRHHGLGDVAEADLIETDVGEPFDNLRRAARDH